MTDRYGEGPAGQPASPRLIDEARIRVRGGEGGNGSASFHREKYRPKGGPDGGDGGHGGSVVLAADPSLETLADLTVRKLFRAGSGAAGSGNNRRGRDGEDVRITVPPGTLVRDVESDDLLADLAVPEAEYVVARGGRGGRGNASLAGAADRAPNFAERGEPGQERHLLLDLRIVADVGLLGAPNAGKSTLLRAISAARPKVGDYPFTTLHPNLGVVTTDEDERYVVADLPGLVEGAAAGRGLGVRFLRHAERCALLALVVDSASPSALDELISVLGEVHAYEEGLAARVGLVVANKIDLADADPGAIVAWARERDLEAVSLSALRGDGVDGLVAALARLVTAARQVRPPPESFAVFRPVEADRIVVEREANGFRVRSARAERAVVATPLDSPRAVRHLQRRLNALGVEAALGRAGARAGDEVYVGEATFEYHPETTPGTPGARRRRKP